MQPGSLPERSGVVASLSALYAGAGTHTYGATQSGADLDARGDGPAGVTFLEHALQCAAAALAAAPADDALIVAALLHDVGWLLPRPSSQSELTSAAGADADAVFIARHDATGSAHLAALGFPARVCALVAGHVAAKRFLVATEPAYAASLSRGSAWTLQQQGGPMTADEVAAFRAGADAANMVALRRWDEAAKVRGLVVPEWGTHLPRLERVLAAARWAPFGSPALPPQRSLAAVVPASLRAALGASGPGFAVVRNWLSADEVAALRAFVAALPAAPASEAFHTYERDGFGRVVPSRTEHFAHLRPDSAGVGAFLADGRLRALCSALREDRPMLLLKEKCNYKLAGKTGGYAPHVDFYSRFDSSTGAREALLDDADVCVCMLAIDAMDEGNGCPFVAPGWHTGGPKVFRGAVESLSLGDQTDVARLPVVDPDTVPWQPVCLAAGDVLIYGNNMPHQSAGNASDRDRRALFAVYADARFGDMRAHYYANEAKGRRANGSGREAGKANGFFTGAPVHVAVAQ